jgi:hypothetical protein
VSSEIGVEYKSTDLQNLIQSLNGDLPRAKVGVLGKESDRGGNLVKYAEDITNADVGLKHEFGTENLPQRSFLRIPITEHLQKFLNKSGAFSTDALKEIMQARSFEPFIRKLGVVGESIVLEGFDSGGFGKWKPSNMKFKKNHQTLVETQQLRNSIASEVIV